MKNRLTISSSFEHPFLAVQTRATMTPPPNMSRRNTASFQPWSLCGISFLAAGNLATSAAETPMRDALTRIVLRRLDAFSQAIFVGLLFEADLDFTCTWSISLGFSPCSSVFRDKLHVWTRPILLRRRDPKALQLLAVCPSFEQCTNWHRSNRVSMMFGNGLCPGATTTQYLLGEIRDPLNAHRRYNLREYSNIARSISRLNSFRVKRVGQRLFGILFRPRTPSVHRTAFYHSRCAHFEYKDRRATQYLSLSVRLLSIWLFSQLGLTFHPPPVSVLRYFFIREWRLGYSSHFPDY